MNKQLDEQRQIREVAGHIQTAVNKYIDVQQKAIAKEIKVLQSQKEAAEARGDSAQANALDEQILNARISQDQWGTGGEYKRATDALTQAVLMGVSGGSAQAIAAAGASPYVNQVIKDVTKDIPSLNLPAHVIWGAIEAELTGGHATTGAISTAAGELGAAYLAEHIFGKKAAELSPEERSKVRDAAKAIAGIAGGLSSAMQGQDLVSSLNDTSVGMTVANNAVGNNYLTANEAARKAELLMLIQRESNPEKKAKYQEELDSLVAKDIRTQKEIEDNCPKFGKSSSACQASIRDAENARRSYDASTDEYQPVGYTQGKRQYKNIFSNDYARTNEALAGKDSLTIQKEAFAIDVAKSKNTSPEQEYNWISNGIDLGWLGEFQGWGRAIKGLPKGANANEKLPIVGETKGYRTTKVNLNNLEIEISKQNKHLENTNEYKVSLANGQQKSIITVSLDSLKGYVGTGQQVGKTEIGLPSSKERVNFNKNIGIYIDPVTGDRTPTTMGIIHYSKNGYHVVPAKPKE